MTCSATHDILTVRVQIADNCTMYDVDLFCIPHHYRDDLESIILPHGIIMDRYARSRTR